MTYAYRRRADRELVRSHVRRELSAYALLKVSRNGQLLSHRGHS